MGILSSPLIVIPKMIPAGERVKPGQKTNRPTCDRCMRLATDRNPVMLSDRKAWAYSGQRNDRKDAICYECRLILKGRL
jgi:hypothetical protein